MLLRPHSLAGPTDRQHCVLYPCSICSLTILESSCNQSSSHSPSLSSSMCFFVTDIGAVGPGCEARGGGAGGVLGRAGEGGALTSGARFVGRCTGGSFRGGGLIISASTFRGGGATAAGG